MQTFIVRIAPAEHPDEAWHGIVRRIADGSERPFHSVDQLLDLMRPEAGGSGRAADTPRPPADRREQAE